LIRLRSHLEIRARVLDDKSCFTAEFFSQFSGQWRVSEAKHFVAHIDDAVDFVPLFDRTKSLLGIHLIDQGIHRRVLSPGDHSHRAITDSRKASHRFLYTRASMTGLQRTIHSLVAGEW
jgi:hypothetical protein